MKRPDWHRVLSNISGHTKNIAGVCPMQVLHGSSQSRNRTSPKRSGIRRASPLIATRTQTGNGKFSSSNVAPSKSAEKLKSAPLMVRKSPSSSVTVPVSVIPNGRSEINIRTLVISCFHAMNKAIARSRWSALDEDECMFLLCVREFGLERATVLATRFHLKCQLPLQVLRAMFDGLDKSCSTQSVTQSRPSSSPVSSKKRS